MRQHTYQHTDVTDLSILIREIHRPYGKCLHFLLKIFTTLSMYQAFASILVQQPSMGRSKLHPTDHLTGFLITDKSARGAAAHPDDPHQRARVTPGHGAPARPLAGVPYVANPSIYTMISRCVLVMQLPCRYITRPVGSNLCPLATTSS